MPEIEITPEQEERLRALQEELASDVVGKYGHVRPQDAVEYLLDRYAADDEVDRPSGAAASGGHAASAGSEEDDDAAAGDGTEDADGGGDDDAGGDDAGGDTTAASGGDDGVLNEMMNLLETHDDKWGESSGDERYAVELPDGSTETARTKDDVKALLFEHYR